MSAAFLHLGILGIDSIKNYKKTRTYFLSESVKTFISITVF